MTGCKRQVLQSWMLGTSRCLGGALVNPYTTFGFFVRTTLSTKITQPPEPKYMTLFLKLCLALSVFTFFPSISPCQILQFAELNTNQIRSLDRTKTVVLIPGGILEQHGPYLPSFTDGYVDAAVTQELA